MIYIYTPYRRDETTYAALRVAQVALEMSNQEVFILPQGTKSGVASSFWDAHVLSRVNVLPAILSATTIVHMGVDHDFITMTQHYRRSVSKKCNQILVPLWQSTRLESVETIRSFFDYCVVPTPSIKKTFTQCVYGKTRTKKLLTVPWDVRSPITKRTGHVRKNIRRICVVADSDAISNSAGFMLSAIDELLNLHSNLEFTLLCTKNFAPTDKQTLKSMLRDLPTRFVMQPMPKLDELATHFHAHDWIWFPSRKSNFGAFATLATTCGCPVLAWDIPPYSDIIKTDETGVLVPCDIKTNWMQAPSAINDTSNFVKYASLAFAQEQIFETMATRSIENSTVFADAWCELLVP
jgi:hypothetical protein